MPLRPIASCNLKPLNDRVYIKVTEAEEKTAWRVVVNRDYQRKGFYWHGDSSWTKFTRQDIDWGSTVLYSKYAGNHFKGKYGSITLILESGCSTRYCNESLVLEMMFWVGLVEAFASARIREKTKTEKAFPLRHEKELRGEKEG